MKIIVSKNVFVHVENVFIHDKNVFVHDENIFIHDDFELSRVFINFVRR